MALPNSPNPISTDMIMIELGIAIQPREWSALWALAKTGSTPKNKANAGGPYVLPDDWWGYINTSPVVSYPFTFVNTSSNTVTPPISCGITLNPGVNTMTLYSADSVLAVNSVLYTTSTLTNGTQYNGGGWYYKSVNSKTYKIHTSGAIIEIIDCSSLFTPYSYTTNVKCYPNGGGTYVFEVEIDVYGAPAWNSITGGTITVTQGSSNTNGVKNILSIGGTKYQCQSVSTFNSGSSVTLSLCNIGVSNGSTTHTHTFTVPVSFNVGEINASTTKTTNVNVT